MITTDQILKNINEYDITKNNIIEFICQGKESDINHFYYRNRLLELLKTSEHLDTIIAMYYKLEYGSPFFGSYTINVDGNRQEIKHSNALREREKKVKAIYSEFEKGNFSELQKILEWAKEFGENPEFDFNIDSLDFEKSNELKKLLFDHKDLIYQKKEMEKTQKSTQVLEVPQKKHRFFSKFFKMLENRKRNKENNNLQEQINEIQEKIDKISEEISSFFTDNGAEKFGEEVFERFKYYDESVGLKDIIDNLSLVHTDWQKFKNDLVSCSELIQNDVNVLNLMKEGKSLNEVCAEIRNKLKEANSISSTHKGIEIDYRTEDIKLNESGTALKPASAKELPEEIKKLEEEYEATMNEQDEVEFIKKCADFHFDFLRVHPFSDGNGRTSRVLLSIMLASRNIILPSLYTTSDQKREFYSRSNDAIEGKYETTENDLFERLSHFYPLVLPNVRGKEDKENKSIDEER